MTDVSIIDVVDGVDGGNGGNGVDGVNDYGANDVVLHLPWWWYKILQSTRKLDKKDIEVLWHWSSTLLTIPTCVWYSFNFTNLPLNKPIFEGNIEL